MGQGFLSKSGISAEIFTGEVHVLSVSGSQYGLRLGFWPTSWFSFGFEGSIANNLSHTERMDFYRYHSFAGLHLRFFKYVNPYIIGTIGKHKEPMDSYGDFDPPNYSLVEKSSTTIKVGLALEVSNLRFAFETGGGSMGTGHIETNYSLSYALRPLPKSKPLTDFTITTGLHSFVAFAGPYEGEKNFPGFDFTLEIEKNGRIREYNAGIFFTNYLFSTGCFNLGTGWRLNSDNKILDYVDVTPGFQVLIWAEGDPDFILPAASLGLGIDYQIWKFVPFIKTRTLATYSRANKFILGTTYTFGIGLSF